MAKTESGAHEITADAELKILQKLAKQRKESAEIYNTQNRPDLSRKETDEAAIIEEYLPKQLSEEEIIPLLKAIIIRTGATSAADMGKVMGAASKELAGKADGRMISSKVKELLASI
jgi:uncharacterized protein YqeY